MLRQRFSSGHGAHAFTWLRFADRASAANSRRPVSTLLLNRRARLWDEEKERQARLSTDGGGLEGSREQSQIPLALLGSCRSAIPGHTTPLDLARKYDQKNAKKYIAALVNDAVIWDMQRPLPSTASRLRFLKFDSNDAASKEVFWHSSAHVMGAALERIYGDDLLLCDGPPLAEGGFFYEFLLLNSGRRPVDRLNKKAHHSMRINELCGHGTPMDGLRFLAASDLEEVNKTIAKIVNEKHMFERLEVDYDAACELFLDNPFKLHFLDRARKNAHQRCSSAAPDRVSLYRCGDMIDLCRGPHVVHTSQLQAFMVNRVSSAHWIGHLDTKESKGSGMQQQKSPVLNRVYGVSFPTSAMLKEHQQRMDEAARRDHRTIGKEQKLFMMHQWAPGSGFLLPHGMRMVNTMMDAIRQKYAKYGFDEVSTPLMYNRKLWETSGHWENYRDDMFTISTDAFDKEAHSTGCCNHHRRSHDGSSSQKGAGSAPASKNTPLNEPEFGLKPMNCPGHCLIFASDQRSYKDLPIRYADFSPLHRNEVAGALSGLTRVRKFHQDDGHIFCAREQVAKEIEGCLTFISDMYGMFGFSSYEFVLSTRPENYIGEISEWSEAEASLKDALNKTGKPWSLNEGDGAFYGPKIDVRVQDALGRKHQTATIQLDFQLPQRFQLRYTGSDGQPHRPVMIHRAVLGSLERMLAILIEHWGGKWPFWINPRQAVVIPTTTSESARGIVEYAQKVRDTLAGDKTPESASSRRFFVDVDLSGNTLNRAVREAQLAQYSYILVVGEKEVQDGTIDVRQRRGGRIGARSVADVRKMFQDLAESYQ